MKITLLFLMVLASYPAGATESPVRLGELAGYEYFLDVPSPAATIDNLRVAKLRVTNGEETFSGGRAANCQSGLLSDHYNTSRSREKWIFTTPVSPMERGAFKALCKGVEGAFVLSEQEETIAPKEEQITAEPDGSSATSGLVCHMGVGLLGATLSLLIGGGKTWDPTDPSNNALDELASSLCK